MYVPCAVAQMVGGGVGEYDRRLRRLEGVHRRLVGGVGQVHDHAQPVKLLYHSLEKKKLWVLICVGKLSVLILTFPNWVSPLCSGITSGLSTL